MIFFIVSGPDLKTIFVNYFNDLNKRVTSFIKVNGVLFHTMSDYYILNKFEKKTCPVFMCSDVCLHAAGSYTSFADSPFSLIYAPTLSNHLLLYLYLSSYTGFIFP